MTDHDYLRRDNPRLLELEAQYAEFGGPALSLWREHQNNVSIHDFRADGSYITEGSKDAYRQAYAVAARLDRYDYFYLLLEDGAFGAKFYPVEEIQPEARGIKVSRDLLDSILEIYFLQDTLGFTEWDSPHVLDIGAGYGRFAHRFSTVFNKSYVLCTDAVPVSTFLCEFYLSYRGVARAARTVPLTTVAKNIGGVDLACNIHSWSECSLDAINWWLDMIADHNIRYLFVVPHDTGWVCANIDGSTGEFKSALERHGYRLMRSDLKPSVDGFHPQTLYTLWRRA